MSPAKNLTRQAGTVTQAQRQALASQRGCVVWLTGLSGSGKSTIAYALEQRLITLGHIAYVLDGDNVRQGLCSDLGFSAEDRDENIRRVGEAAALFADAGIIAIAGFISPYMAARKRARERTGPAFIEAYLDVPVAVCEARDPKGLYRRARAGEITNFTGVSAPYEEPNQPELRLDTESLDVNECVDRVIQYLDQEGFLTAA